MIKHKAILITGGAGFIGSHLAEKLLNEENFVVIIDNFNDYYQGKRKNIAEISESFEKGKDYKIIKADLVNKNLFNSLESDFDYIFHLAAQAGVRYSIKNAAEVSHNNITSTVNIFEYALKTNIKKIAFASSSSIYGNPEYTPVDEKHPKNPISPYAITKLTGEIYADYYYQHRDLPVTSLRFYTVYGPRGRPDMAIRKFFKLILSDEEITVYGDGNQLRDFTYVSDLVDGLILAAETDKATGEAFNLGVSNPISVNQLIEKMYKITGKPRKIRHIEKQPGDVEITHSDTTKAKELLNYHPQVDIDKGLSITYDWMKKVNRMD